MAPATLPPARLGTLRDSETDAATPLDSHGDDNTASNDEDGLSSLEVTTVINQGNVVSTTATATVNISNSTGSARLYGWIDFNSDGDFTDAGEQIASGATALASGDHVVSFTVPASANWTSTYARFRVATQSGLAFDGAATDGEVEDYRIGTGGSAQSDVSTTLIRQVRTETTVRTPVDVWFGTITAPAGMTVPPTDIVYFSTTISTLVGATVNIDSAVPAPVKGDVDDFIDPAITPASQRIQVNAQAAQSAAYSQAVTSLQGQTSQPLNVTYSTQVVSGPRDYGAGVGFAGQTTVDNQLAPNLLERTITDSYIRGFDDATYHEVNLTVTLPVNNPPNNITLSRDEVFANLAGP